ncbi:MAG: SURF1 family protein [Gammaproteobacteria bacterium]|nr:SURF1 family protein [Gammaproteobacteria bacterium]NNJ51503.1 SURF1 family protein [Gammaproteobacteria bacterium]
MSIIKAIRDYRLVSIKFAGFRFHPGIVSSLVTAALLYTMISLGLWQLDRAEYKDTLQHNISERKKLSPLSLKELPATTAERRFHPALFSGEFDAQHSFLLDNITFNGRVGYHVFTPVKIDRETAVLVARGFVAQGETRDQLPEITTPDGELEFIGLLDLPPSRTLLLAENVHQISRWPAVLQYIDIDEIGQLLDYELYDMVIWLNPDASGVFEHDLPVLNLNSAKNNGYAFQWFAMSVALLIIYLVVNTKRMVKQ